MDSLVFKCMSQSTSWLIRFCNCCFWLNQRFISSLLVWREIWEALKQSEWHTFLLYDQSHSLPLKTLSSDKILRSCNTMCFIRTLTWCYRFIGIAWISFEPPSGMVSSHLIIWSLFITSGHIVQFNLTCVQEHPIHLLPWIGNKDCVISAIIIVSHVEGMADNSFHQQSLL